MTPARNATGACAVDQDVTTRKCTGRTYYKHQCQHNARPGTDRYGKHPRTDAVCSSMTRILTVLALLALTSCGPELVGDLGGESGESSGQPMPGVGDDGGEEPAPVDMPACASPELGCECTPGLLGCECYGGECAGLDLTCEAGQCVVCELGTLGCQCASALGSDPWCGPGLSCDGMTCQPA